MKNDDEFKTVPLFHVILGVSALLMAVLACSEPDRRIDPTLLAPMNLSKQDLSYKNMAETDFSGKNMQGVNMTGSEIIGANFTNTDLRSADLSDGIAYNAIFHGTDLRGAKLDRLCFLGAAWTDAKLDPHWSEIVALLAEGSMITKDLAGLDLSGVCLVGYELKGLNLHKADLSKAQLARTNFAGTNLQEVNLTEARLGNTYLLDATLKGAIVTEGQLEQAVLCRTVLPNGQVSNRDCHLLSESPAP
jgi:uncharacterized protein YjbI with pentapeptide repeats